MPHPQDGQEGEDNDLAVAESRPAQTFVSLVPAPSSSRSCSYPDPVSPRSPDGRLQSSNVVGMEKPGPPALSTDDVSACQEANEGNEQIGMGKPDAPNGGGNATTRDPALNYISDS